MAGMAGAAAQGGAMTNAGHGGTISVGGHGAVANGGGGAVLDGGVGGSSTPGVGGTDEGGRGGTSSAGGNAGEAGDGLAGDGPAGAGRAGDGQGGNGHAGTEGGTSAGTGVTNGGAGGANGGAGGTNGGTGGTNGGTGGEGGQACPPGNNVVENGDFEIVNFAFTTEYEPVTAPDQINDTGECIFAPNPSVVRVGATDWSAFGDHTTGSGNMLICDGAVTERYVWQQTLTVEPHEEYVLHFWFASVQTNAIFPPSFQPFADGVALGDSLAADPSGAWTEYTAAYNAGESTTVALSLVDTSTEEAQNDFALDDVSLALKCSQ